MSEVPLYVVAIRIPICSSTCIGGARVQRYLAHEKHSISKRISCTGQNALSLSNHRRLREQVHPQGYLAHKKQPTLPGP